VILRHIHTHEGNDTNFYILSLRKAIFSNISILEKAFNAKFFDPGKVLSGENVLRPTPIVGNISMNLKIPLLTCTRFVHTLKYGISMGQQKS